MLRMSRSGVTVLVVLLLAFVVPQEASGLRSGAGGSSLDPAAGADSARTLQGAGWLRGHALGATPLLHNPTNIDIDCDGRIWVAEGVRYRSHHARQPDGDRIIVIEDTDE